MMEANDNLMFQLREASKECSDVDYRFAMRAQADEIQKAINTLYTDSTHGNMLALNGAWAKGYRLVINVPPEAPPASPSAAGEVEPMRMAA